MYIYIYIIFHYIPLIHTYNIYIYTHIIHFCVVSHYKATIFGIPHVFHDILMISLLSESSQYASGRHPSQKHLILRLCSRLSPAAAERWLWPWGFHGKKWWENDEKMGKSWKHDGRMGNSWENDEKICEYDGKMMRSFLWENTEIIKRTS